MILRVLSAICAMALLSACAMVPATETDLAGAMAGGGAGVDPAVAQLRAASFVEVVTAVEPVAEAECRRQNPAGNCDFRIVVDDRRGMPPNAFQMEDDAGRPIIAFTLALIADVLNADEMAFIMAHEASHHILGHLERQDRNAAVGAEVFGELAAARGATSDAEIRAAQQLGAAVGAQSYSKLFELEADALGTVLTARAGYDPLKGAEFFFRIPEPGNGFLSTHPPNAERLAVVREVSASLGFN
jgi:Zn-dependent protease with chaperone function